MEIEINKDEKEMMKIYSPNDELILETDNINTVLEIRLQVYKNDLKGYYLIDSNNDKWYFEKRPFDPYAINKYTRLLCEGLHVLAEKNGNK